MICQMKEFFERSKKNIMKIKTTNRQMLLEFNYKYSYSNDVNFNNVELQPQFMLLKYMKVEKIFPSLCLLGNSLPKELPSLYDLDISKSSLFYLLCTSLARTSKFQSLGLIYDQFNCSASVISLGETHTELTSPNFSQVSPFPTGAES